jgi:N-acetylmuramoyl-L-alanine amidase CwlA
MEILGRRLSLQEFEAYIREYDFGSLPANRIVLHHTWRPTKAGWQGERTILGLKKYYEQKGWSAGPHLFIAEDGIWLFSPMRSDGIHAGVLNHRSIGIEVVGDYDAEVWSGATKMNTLGAIKALMGQLSIPEKEIYFHRDVSSKSCPGKAITKEWVIGELRNIRTRPRIPTGLPLDSAPSPLVPDWAEEAVQFVLQHKLFAISTEQDVRDAVKFHRFYKLIKPV